MLKSNETLYCFDTDSFEIDLLSRLIGRSKSYIAKHLAKASTSDRILEMLSDKSLRAYVAHCEQHDEAARKAAFAENYEYGTVPAGTISYLALSGSRYPKVTEIPIAALCYEIDVEAIAKSVELICELRESRIQSFLDPVSLAIHILRSSRGGLYRAFKETHFILDGERHETFHVEDALEKALEIVEMIALALDERGVSRKNLIKRRSYEELLYCTRMFVKDNTNVVGMDSAERSFREMLWNEVTSDDGRYAKKEFYSKYFLNRKTDLKRAAVERYNETRKEKLKLRTEEDALRAQRGLRKRKKAFTRNRTVPKGIPCDVPNTARKNVLLGTATIRGTETFEGYDDRENKTGGFGAAVTTHNGKKPRPRELDPEGLPESAFENGIMKPRSEIRGYDANLARMRRKYR